MDVIYIIDFFLLYSFIGWVLESVYKTLLTKKIVNSGFLYGPFCPIYGIGALIMYFCLSGYNDNIMHVFLIGFVILSIWEYLVAWFLEIIFHEKYWDYSENRFNIDGRVCLLNSVFWGILGVIFIYVIHPFIQLKILEIDYWLLIISTIILSIYITIDTIVNIIKLRSIDKKIEDINNLRNEIKRKLEELKKLKNNRLKQRETIQLLINDLKTQERSMKEKLIKQTERIRKAFPSMKSEKFKEIAKYRRK